MLLRDHDGKFLAEFDALLESEGIEVKKVGPRAPNLNAHIERWGQSLQQECLDHFVCFGEDHLRYLVSEYLAYYHHERPHQSFSNQTLCGAPPPAPQSVAGRGEVVCKERLGGLLKHFSRRAA
jgi:putative transposase